jgi:selT/selW/selH-like putative selenoprotein
LKSQLGINAELIKSSGGVFEVTVGNELIYSKKATGEFPDEQQLVKKLVTGQGRDTL